MASRRAMTCAASAGRAALSFSIRSLTSSGSPAGRSDLMAFSGIARSITCIISSALGMEDRNGRRPESSW